MKEKIKDKDNKIVNIEERLEKEIEDTSITLNKKNKIIFIIILIVVTIIATILIAKSIISGKEKYLIVNGIVEKSNAVTGYVIKEETIMQTDISKTVVPVIADGKKVKKDGVIATYNNKATTEKNNRLEELDKEILSAMSSIPQIFSSDIKNIEDSIQQITKQAMYETSYTKIQEYKKKINDLINKKAVIVGELSPSGAHIKDLIAKRNNLNNEISNSKDNIIATASGIVSYKLDGLEEKITFNNITNLSIELLKKYTEQTKNKSNYGIKIVNNFKAYIMFEIDKSELVEGTKEGQKKYIRLLDEDSDDIPVYINKIEEKGEKYDITIELDQGIEYFVNRREVAFDFIWWSYNGLKIPNQAIFTKNDIKYISTYRNEEVIEIPIVVIKESEKFSIIRNYKSDELKEKNLTSIYAIQLYDEIIL